jgi:hypoxanthine phosphoribosyltransferase
MDILIAEDRIRQRVDEIAADINRDFAGKPFTVVGILTGSLVFLADLIRRIEHPHQIGLIQASSYRGGTVSGTLVVNDALLPDVKGRHLLLMDDILDTGQTLVRLVEHLYHKGAASIRTCVLLWAARRCPTSRTTPGSKSRTGSSSGTGWTSTTTTATCRSSACCRTTPRTNATRPSTAVRNPVGGGERRAAGGGAAAGPL